MILGQEAQGGMMYLVGFLFGFLLGSSPLTSKLLGLAHKDDCVCGICKITRGG